MAQPPPPGYGVAPPPVAYPPQPGGGYPPPAGGGYPPPAGGVYAPPATTVVVGVGTPQLGFEPTVVTCPHCQQSVQTLVNYDAGLLTYLAVGACLLFGCWAGCCLIPCCVNNCQDARHSCPSCKKVIGTKTRMS